MEYQAADDGNLKMVQTLLNDKTKLTMILISSYGALARKAAESGKFEKSSSLLTPKDTNKRLFYTTFQVKPKNSHFNVVNASFAASVNIKASNADHIPVGEAV